MVEFELERIERADNVGEVGFFDDRRIRNVVAASRNTKEFNRRIGSV